MCVDERDEHRLDIPRTSLCCTFDQLGISISYYVGTYDVIIHHMFTIQLNFLIK